MSHRTEPRQPMKRLQSKTALITGGAGAIECRVVDACMGCLAALTEP